MMQNKFRGVMQSPVTPLKDDYSLDLPTFERLLDFHVRTGAPAISWPHHKAESLNLTIVERKLFAEAAVKTVNGRVPVTIHVSALAVEDTFELAAHAQKIGADGILAITPYFWNPAREHEAPPSTQNFAQCGWLSGTARAASASVGPSSKAGS